MPVPRQARVEAIAWRLGHKQTRLHPERTYVSRLRFEQDWLAAQARQVNARPTSRRHSAGPPFS